MFCSCEVPGALELLLLTLGCLHEQLNTCCGFCVQITVKVVCMGAVQAPEHALVQSALLLQAVMPFCAWSVQAVAIKMPSILHTACILT